MPPNAKVTYKDATGTEVDAEIFSDLIGQGNVVLTVFSNDEFSDSLSSISEKSDKSNSSSASTVIFHEVPNKRQRKEDTSALSAKQATPYLSYQRTVCCLHSDTVPSKIHIPRKATNTFMMLQATQDTLLGI